MEGGLVDDVVAIFTQDGVGGEVVGGGEDVGVGKVSHGVGLGWAFGIFVFLLLQE